MRLMAFVRTLAGATPLGPAALVFILPAFLAAGGASAGEAAAAAGAAAAGASKNCFGILFLFDGMVVEIMVDTTPAFGGPPTGTSTTAGEGGASPAVGGSCGRSMAAGSGREGRGGGDQAAAAAVGFSETQPPPLDLLRPALPVHVTAGSRCHGSSARAAIRRRCISDGRGG